MKTLIYGAGPLGSLYIYLLYKAGNDVTILARDEHYQFLKENGVVLVNEFKTLTKQTSIDTSNLDELISCISSN